MSHCTIDQLTDHVLGLADRETSERVDDHLASGCERCGTLLAVLSRIGRIGRFDETHQVDGAMLRSVKALCGLGRPGDRRRRIPMRLTFDSLRNPAVVGTRSLHSSSRHLVFTSQNFALDLRMDYERSIRDVVVVGQLLNRNWGPLSDIPAYLRSGDRVVSHSTTGRLGEFHMEGRPRGPMHLQLMVNDEELIDVEIDRRREVRPVLMGRDDLDDSDSAPDPTHSRSTDSGRSREPRR